MQTQETTHEMDGWLGFTCPVYAIPDAGQRIADFNDRMAKRGIPGRAEMRLGDHYTRRVLRPGCSYEDWDYHIDTHTREIELVDGHIIPIGDFKLGGWRIIGVYDFTESELPIRLRMAEGHTLPETVDRQHCDHCGTRRNRNVITAITDGAETMMVGLTCLKDFTGHSTRQLAPFWTGLDNLVGGFGSEEDGFEMGGQPTHYLQAAYIAAAAAAIRAVGFAKADSDDQLPTKDAAVGILRGWADWRDVKVTDADRQLAADAVAWAAGLDEHQSDFNWNMRIVAEADAVGRRTMGLAAYLPEGYRRHLARQAEQAADTSTAPVPADFSNDWITGTVLKAGWHENNYGVSLKVTVLDDRGFKVWGTVPQAAIFRPVEPEVGDRVKFKASKIDVSDRDECFGFFKRPRDWEYLNDKPCPMCGELVSDFSAHRTEQGWGGCVPADAEPVGIGL